MSASPTKRTKNKERSELDTRADFNRSAQWSGIRSEHLVDDAIEFRSVFSAEGNDGIHRSAAANFVRDVPNDQSPNPEFVCSEIWIVCHIANVEATGKLPLPYLTAAVVSSGASYANIYHAPAQLQANYSSGAGTTTVLVRSSSSATQLPDSHTAV